MLTATRLWALILLLIALGQLYVKYLSTVVLPTNRLLPSMSSAQGQSWRDIARNKMQEGFGKIPKEWVLSSSILNKAKTRRKIAGDFIEGLLDDETIHTTNLDAPELIQHMSNGSVSAVQVVTAFCKRAAYA